MIRFQSQILFQLLIHPSQGTWSIREENAQIYDKFDKIYTE
jgi:hypothetical protein